MNTESLAPSALGSIGKDTRLRLWWACVFLLIFCADAAGQAPFAANQQLQVGWLPCAQAQSPRSGGVRQLAWELVKRTSVEAQMEPVEVDPASPDLFRTPFLIWSCAGPVAELSETALSNLHRFLILGGFLLADDPEASPGSDFDKSFRHILAKLLPGQKLRRLTPDHVLFRTFFLIRQSAGRVSRSDLLGVEIADRLAVLYSGNDLLGALSKDHFGNWEHACEPGGELQREASFRLGINIVFYSLCLGYKNDAVHLPFILRRRRL